MQTDPAAPRPSGPSGVYERFPETSWTLLSKAREGGDAGGRAREDLARRYYPPVHEFLLTLVSDEEKARDLTQEFFARLSESGGILEHADREKGAFRDYVKQALRHLVIDHFRRSNKEGYQIHPDQASTAGWEILDLAEFPAAEAAFHFTWVKVTLAEALTRVRALCIKRKQEPHLNLFEARYLCDADRERSWSELGAPYGLDGRTARERADTVARHFRLVLRRMLRNEITVPDGAPVSEGVIDQEIRALLSPLKD